MALTNEQYLFLIKEKGNMESVSAHGIYTGVNANWLNDFTRMYKILYPSDAPMRQSCGACVKSALLKVYPLVIEYENK